MHSAQLPRGCFRRCAALRFGRGLPGPLGARDGPKRGSRREFWGEVSWPGWEILELGLICFHDDLSHRTAHRTAHCSPSLFRNPAVTPSRLASRSVDAPGHTALSRTSQLMHAQTAAAKRQDRQAIHIHALLQAPADPGG